LGARLGVVLAVVVALTAARPALGQEEADPDPAAGMLPPGDWTDEQVAEALDLIARTEAALPAYADSSQLEALGFFNFGVTAPGGYDHWINPDRIDDDHILDPEVPESLVYRYTDDGGYELQAAMFYLPTGYDMTDIPEDIAWLPGWHMHDELCVDDDGRYTGLVDGEGNCFSGHPADMPPMTHIWIVDNECGHRFGSIGVGGLECDVNHHPHDPGDPEQPEHPEHPEHPENPDHPHDPEHPENPDHPHDPDEHPPGHEDPMAPGHHHPEAPPANPVHHHPTFAG
jgi:hypothetical protein